MNSIRPGTALRTVGPLIAALGLAITAMGQYPGAQNFITLHGRTMEEYNQLSQRFNTAFDKRDLPELTALLKEEPQLAKGSGMAGKYYLHLATERGDVEVVELLIVAGADVNRPGDGLQSGGSKRTPLHLAAAKGDLAMVRELLASKAGVNAREFGENTPLHLALAEVWKLAPPGVALDATNSRALIIIELVKHGADIFALNREYRFPQSPASIVSRPGREVFLDLLLTNSASIRTHDAMGNSRLHVAVATGRELVLPVLIDQGLGLNRTNGMGMTPIQLLASLNLPPNIVTNPPNPWQPLQPAAAQSRKSLAGILRAHGAELDVFSAAGLGLGEIVPLLNAQPRAIAARDARGRTPLHWAAANGERGMVDLLLRRGASIGIVDQDGRTALHTAIEQNQPLIAARLVDAGSPVSAADAAGRTPLHLAAMKGAEFGALCRSLLAKKADVLQIDKSNRTPLHYAAEVGNLESIELLLAAGAKGDSRDSKGASPLDLAAAQNQEGVVRRLMKSGSPVSSGSKPHTAPLHSAVIAGNQGLVRDLIRSGADLNAQDSEGNTPLILASDHNDLPMMDLLLNAGANINAPDRGGNTVVHHRMLASMDIVAKLPPPPNFVEKVSGQFGLTNLPKVLNLGTNHPATPPKPTPGTTTPGAVGTASSGPSPPSLPTFTRAKPGPPASNSESILQYLLDHQADFSAQSFSGESPLHWLAKRPFYYRDTEEILKLLLANGVRINTIDHQGRTVIRHVLDQYKRFSGMENQVKERLNLMVKHGADVNLPDGGGVTPLHIAARVGSVELVEILLGHGALVDALDKSGKTPLHDSPERVDWIPTPIPGSNTAWNGRPNVISTLLKKGADVNAQDNDGNTPLHYLVVKESYAADWLPLLIAEKAGLNLQNKLGQTPAHRALTKGWPYSGVGEILKQLADAGANLRLKDRAGRTIFHYLAAKDKNPLFFIHGVDTLLSTAKSEIDAKDENGDTALHLAARSGNTQVLQWLIENKADNLITNHHGQTPLGAAFAQFDGSVDHLLLPAGITNTIFEAAAKGDVATVEALLKFEPSLRDKTNLFGQTPLKIATRAGKTAVVARLVAAKPAIDPESAAFMGRNDLLAIELKKNPRTVDNYWAGAIGSNNRDCVDLLLSHGANPKYEFADGHSPLFAAQTNRNPQVADLIRDRGGEFNIFDAVSSVDGSLLIKLLDSNPAAINSTNRGGMTPLHLAAEEGMKAMCEMLIAHKASVNALVPSRMWGGYPRTSAGKKSGTTPLHLAARGGWTEVGELLLKNGADPGILDIQGISALHFAAAAGNSAFAEMILTNGGSADIRTEILGPPEISSWPGGTRSINPYRPSVTDETPLHLAADFHRTNVIEVLLARGAAIDAEDSAGTTPLELAKETFGFRNRVFRLSLLKPANRGNEDTIRMDKESQAATIDLLIRHGADKSHVSTKPPGRALSPIPDLPGKDRQNENP